MFLTKCGAFYLINSPSSILHTQSIVKVGIFAAQIAIGAFLSKKHLSLSELGLLAVPIAGVCLSRYLFLFYASSPVVVSLAILFAIAMSLDKLSLLFREYLGDNGIDDDTILKTSLACVYVVSIVLANIFSLHTLATLALLLDVVFAVVLALTGEKPEDPIRTFVPFKDEYTGCMPDPIKTCPDTIVCNELIYGCITQLFDSSKPTLLKIKGFDLPAYNTGEGALTNEESDKVEANKAQLVFLKNYFASFMGCLNNHITAMNAMIAKRKSLLAFAEGLPLLPHKEFILRRFHTETLNYSNMEINSFNDDLNALLQEAVNRCTTLLGVSDRLLLDCFTVGTPIHKEVCDIASAGSYMNHIIRYVETRFNLAFETIRSLEHVLQMNLDKMS